MMIEPIGERVLLQALAPATKTEGGIYIPDSASKERNEGVVVAVGKFANGTPLPLKPADQVIYTNFSVNEFEHAGQKFIIVDFKDIIAKVHRNV
tara:strand:+ start:2823 stop:3104 length:282 start_codon:yes stop_codon:yes gene_type:complete